MNADLFTIRPVTIAEPQLDELRVMPFVIVRIAGLPASYGVDIPGKEASAIAGQLRGLVREQKILAAELVDALFQAVAHPDASAHRAQLLRDKRQVFNLAQVMTGTAALEWLGVASPSAFALHQAYWRITQKRTLLETQLADICVADQQATQSALQAVLNQPAFARALGLAVPRLLTQLATPLHAHRPKRRKQLERTLLAFMLRASMKISPFSSFASIFQAKLNLKQEQGYINAPEQHLKGQSRLNRSVVVSLRELLVNSPLADSKKVQFTLNPSMKVFTDELGSARSLRAHARRYQLRRGVLWSEESLLSAKLAPAMSQLLLALPSCFSREAFFTRLLALGTDPIKAEYLLRQLIRKDVVRVLPQWGAQEDGPAVLLAEAMRAHPLMERLAQRLTQVDNRAREFANLSSQNRPAELDSLKHEIATLHQGLSELPPPRLSSIVYEDVCSEGFALNFGALFAKNTLARIAKVIGQRARVSTEYLWLRERFLQCYGEGGRCIDIEGFLREAWPAYWSFSQQVLNGDLSSPESDTLATAALRLPLTVYFQLATADPNEALNGRPLLVINGAYHRAAWQLTRGAGAKDQAHTEQTDQRRNWLTQAHLPFEPITVTVSGESSNLQAQPRLTERQLCLDQHCAQSEDLALRDLQLVHNPNNGLLELVDSKGFTLALQYLGGASPLTAWGVKYLVTVLAEPVHIARPEVDLISASYSDADFRHQSRIEDDGCVLLRETWWLRAKVLLSQLDNLPPAAQLTTLLNICDQYKIPEEVFVNGQVEDFFSWKSSTDHKTRKPFWCRLSNVACVDYLLGLARDTDWLVFREALPAPGDSWLRIAGEPYVTELHTEMVLVGGQIAYGWNH